MTISSELEITHLGQNQNSPEVTVNEAINRLDTAMGGILNYNFTSDADYTLLTTGEPPEWMNAFLYITDTGTNLTTGRNIILPSTQKFYFVWNNTAQTITFKTSGASGVAVLLNENAIIHYNGANYAAIYNSA